MLTLWPSTGKCLKYSENIANTDGKVRSMNEMDDKRILDLLTRLTKTLGELLGASSEVVLHDLRQPDHTIVAIANQQLSGRKLGDSIDALGMRLFTEHGFQDMANYDTLTESGKTLRSCSVFVHDEKGEPIIALCVNQDLTPMLSLRTWLDHALHVTPTPAEPEHAENNVENVLTSLTEDAIRATGKLPEQFTREDKLSVISYLDARGAFLIRYSVEKVAALLGISKFSIYNYLGSLREGDSETAAL
jgi:predicted transcriptional regulator YheO